MTLDDHDQSDVAQDRQPDGKVLHVVAGDDGFHLVTAETLAAADEAQSLADASPYYEDFGELRRSGELGALAERLNHYGLSLDAYMSAIERSAGRVPASSDLGERLADLDDVDFDGDDKANAPSDSDDFRAEWEIDNEVENLYMHTIAQGMCEDVPADILDSCYAFEGPMFVDYETAAVEADRLDEMIRALEARAYIVIRH